MSAKSRPSRHPSLVRRRLIVEAATALIAEKGLAATNAREIAAAAHVSLGTLTYHFSSVDEILIQVLWAATESFEERRHKRIVDAVDPLDRILGFLTAYVDAEVHPRTMWRIWLDCWARAAHDPELQRWQLARYHHVYQEIASLIQDGVEKGRFPSVDADDCARELVALVDGLGEQMLIDPELTPDRAMTILEGAIRRRLEPAAPRRNVRGRRASRPQR